MTKTRIAGRRASLRIVVALATGVCAAALLALPPGAQAPAEREFGDQLFEAGDYARAADALRAAYRASPSEELRFKLARALYGAGDFAGALETLEGADDGAEPAQAALKAETLASLGRFDEARDAAALAGPAYAGRFALISARAYYAQGDEARAEKYLAEALRAGGEALGEAWAFRARIALEKGATADARAAGKRAAEAGADERAVAAIEIEALVREGRVKEAIARIERAAASPQRTFFGRRARARLDAQTDYLAGFAKAAAGDYAEAARLLRPAEQRLVHEARGRLILAAVRRGAGDAAQAEALYLDARFAAPSDPATLDALAAFYADAGRLEEALAVAAALEKAAPQLGALRRLDILTRAGDADALVWAVRAIEKEGKAPLFASAALFGANAAPARKETEKRERLEALAAAGAARASGEAKRASAAAARLAPYTEDPAALILAGDLLVVAGEEARARAQYEAASALAPQAWEPVAALVRADVRAGAYSAVEARLARRLQAAGDAPRLAERLALARSLRAQERSREAAIALFPAEAALSARAGDALFYAALLAGAGEMERLKAFAERARRAHPAAPETVDILSLAGRSEEAAAAARRAALADPSDPARLDAYRAAMAKVGRGGEAESFLEALSHARRGKGRAENAEGFVSPDEARLAYVRRPDDAAAALQYGTLLRNRGDSGALAVLREACFWRTAGDCAALGREES